MNHSIFVPRFNRGTGRDVPRFPGSRTTRPAVPIPRFPRNQSRGNMDAGHFFIPRSHKILWEFSLASVFCSSGACGGLTSFSLSKFRDPARVPASRGSPKSRKIHPAVPQTLEDTMTLSMTIESVQKHSTHCVQENTFCEP